ncbi:hypothetical protein AVEN_274001-1 [Araneus ventricosus]|uniref:Uncharacterized protein n=1 Tax=Araneus ventricosus TaxID=182803 RepID=A0A4Y2DV76_ARAVE|nr:hypothetical protein AVEN_274001-1 [Araneus ventricosus]
MIKCLHVLIHIVCVKLSKSFSFLQNAPKKRASLNSITPSGKNSRLLRLTEISLQTNSVYSINILGKETYGHLKDQYKIRASEEPAQTQQCLQKQCITQQNLRASEEPLQAQQRLKQQCIRQENVRASEEPIQTKQRLQQQCIRQEFLRTSELPDYRE